jgi:hypothetical protein
MSRFKVGGNFKDKMVSNKDDRLEVVRGKPVAYGTYIRMPFDTTKFLKVFSDFDDVIGSLSASGIVILVYIMKQMRVAKFGHMVFCFNHIDLAMPKASFYKGLNELLELHVITKTYIAHQYEVNPNIIFNGKRKKEDDQPS